MSRGMFPPPWNMAARIRAGRFTRFPLRCCSQGLSGRRTMCPLPAGCGWLRNSVGHAEIGANVGNPHDLVVRRCGPGMTHFDPQQPFASIDGNAGPCPISVVRSRNQIPARTTESEPSVPVADGFATTATSKRFEMPPRARLLTIRWFPGSSSGPSEPIREIKRLSMSFPWWGQVV